MDRDVARKTYHVSEDSNVAVSGDSGDMRNVSFSTVGRV